MITNKAVYISVWENKPIVSASNLTNLLKATDYHFGACEEYNHQAKRISWEEFNYKYGGEDLLGKIVYLESGKEETVWVFWTDLFNTEDVNDTEPELEEEEDNFPEKLNIGFCKFGSLSKKRKIFWEIQLFAFPRSFKDGIQFFCINIKWDRYISEHTPSFEIEITILNCYNSFRINKYNQ
jgi:hypothetical protein